ncbi:MAG: iron-containing alcohol dehydrogenase [Planctomycetia bacterium]|nr:iron-containing alcohol dehydrogenase [Planctomycetia bacterium]
MIPFDFETRTRVVFGPNRLAGLGELAQGLGGRRALVVSDHGIIEAGHTPRAVALLQAAGLTVRVFSDLVENPTTDDVERGLAVAKEFQPDVLIGLGGGSSMDCAKGINFLYTNGGRIQDYWGSGKAKRPLLPLIGVPTTAGTGSEAQSFALISDPKSHVKMACGDKKAACRIALLDPLLTVTQPPRVTAITGIDAISHALETYVTKPRNAASLAFGREAWRLLEPNFPRVLDHPGDVDARAAMQLGAFFAGLAIENSMLGAAHALANPLTQAFGIVHGQAVALTLPHVIRFNAAVTEPQYAELLAISASHNGSIRKGQGGAAEELARRVSAFTLRAGLKTRLRDFDIPQDRLPDLAAAAATQWTAGFNPRPVGPEELLQLYRAAYD